MSDALAEAGEILVVLIGVAQGDEHRYASTARDRSVQDRAARAPGSAVRRGIARRTRNAGGRTVLAARRRARHGAEHGSEGT